MMGYYKQPELTAETIIDGWLHTGDIGVFEDGKYLKITDRKKELFKTSGGKYVAPQPIENKMKESIYIEQFCVVGAGQKFPGGLVVPNFIFIKDWLQKQGINVNSNEEIIKNQKVIDLLNAEVNKFVFPFDSKLKVPHMGWNYVDVKKQSEVLEGVDNQSRFYFVHSYFVSCNSDSDVLTKTTYDSPFVSAFERDNLIGVQFHPEKSHRYGITLFKNFIDKI
jgi:acyl-CoA synthetase (AMP-forming)/AMP-acid ligase II